MGDDSVIIIGAGLAGLSAGVYAQVNGYRSRIFEHHALPGGVATGWRRGEYWIDGGIHFLMGNVPGTPTHDLYTQLGVNPACRCVGMSPYTVMRDLESGRSIAITADIDRFAEELGRASPRDAKAIGALAAGAKAFAASGAMDFGMDKPPEMDGPLDKPRMMWRIRKLFRYSGGPFGRPVSEFGATLCDPWVRFVVENLFMPEVPVWFVMMILGLGATDGGMTLLADGSLHFARAIERRYLDLGGEVIYRATVEEVLVENDRAVGVRLSDGSTHRADTVVSAADGHSTIFRMLGGRYLDDRIRQRYATWAPIRPWVIVSLGVARNLSDEPWSQVVRLDRPIRIGDAEVPGFGVRVFNYAPDFAPPGKTVVQVAFDSEWAYWNTLRQTDRSAYNAEKERVAEEVLDRLEPLFPRITSDVEVTDVATPYTTWRYTLNREGAYMGWLPTPEALMARIPRTLPGLRGFTMAGQWVMPGGGVPPCLASGRHAIQLLCRDDRREFTAT